MEHLNSSQPISSKLGNNTFSFNEDSWTDINETANSVNDTTCIGFSEGEWKIYHQLSWWLEGIGMLTVGSFGIFFNTIAICILLTKELVTSSFNNLVISLAIVDNMFLLNSVLYHIAHVFGLQIKDSYIHQKIFTSFLYPSRNVTMCCSTYMTVILALDRYNALFKPAKYNSTIRTTSHPIIYVLRYTVPIIFLSVVFNIPKYFDLEIKESVHSNETNSTYMATSNHSTTYILVDTDLRRNQTYVFWYVNVANFLVTCLIPLVSLIYLNGNLYQRRKNFLQQQIQRRQGPWPNVGLRRQKIVVSVTHHTQQTIILHAVVIVFVVCHSLRIILNVAEWIYTMNNKAEIKSSPNECYKFWTLLAQPVSHLLLQINSGANFFKMGLIMNMNINNEP